MPAVAAHGSARNARKPGTAVPTARLAEALEEYFLVSDQRSLEERSGVNGRRIWGIRHLVSKMTSVTVADELLVAAGLSHLWYLPADQGGFADVYFHPSVMEAA